MINEQKEDRREKLAAPGQIRNHFRLLLLQARADALANAEDAEKVIFAIECFGRYLLGRDASLERTGPELNGWVCSRLTDERAIDFQRKLELLVRGRNDRMHKGFAAKNLTIDAVRVALILEETLRVNWRDLKAKDLMTPSPVVAREWYTIGMVRDALIESSFSYLPILHPERGWGVISDRKVAELTQFVRSNRGPDLRNEVLAQVHDGVVTSTEDGTECYLNQLFEKTDPIGPETSAVAICMSKGCVLVVDGDHPDALLGIITPADIF